MARALLVLSALLAGCGDGGGKSSDIDERLVGNWRYTRAHSLLGTDIYSNLRADGTYAYSSQTVVRPPNVDPFQGQGSSGRWKAKDSVLYARPDGQENWIEIGRYSISGNSLVLYPPGGGQATYWER
jgi:hypothetical protein